MNSSIAQQVRTVSANAEYATRADEFIKAAQLICLHGNRAAYADEAERTTPRVQRVLKGAVTPMDTTGAVAVSSDLQTLGDAFASTLQGISVFDTLLANGLRRVPLRARGIVISTTATGAIVGEGHAKPISELSLTAATIEPQKAWAAVAATKELLDFSRPGAREMFRVELQEAVTLATDSAFLSQLVAATTPTPSSGPSFANTLTDLAALLAAVDIGPTSRVVWVITTARAKLMALMMTGAGGLFAFPNLTVRGGTIAGGIEVMTSDALPTNTSLLIVADGVVGNSASFELKQIREGDIIVDTAPDSPSTASTVLKSMWMHNIAAIAVERYFAFEVARTRTIASLSY